VPAGASAQVGAVGAPAGYGADGVLLPPGRDRGPLLEGPARAMRWVGKSRRLTVATHGGILFLDVHTLQSLPDLVLLPRICLCGGADVIWWVGGGRGAPEAAGARAHDELAAVPLRLCPAGRAGLCGPGVGGSEPWAVGMTQGTWAFFWDGRCTCTSSDTCGIATCRLRLWASSRGSCPPMAMKVRHLEVLLALVVA
jgi:hypothetical protein